MKKFLKNNKLALLIFSILFIWIIVTAYKYEDLYNKNVKAHYELLDICEKDQEHIKISLKTCESIKNSKEIYKKDFITIFSQLIIGSNLKLIAYLAPLIIIIPATIKPYNDMKSGSIKNKLTRVKYKEYLKSCYLESLKNIWILPAFVITIFIASIILSGGNFNTSKALIDYPDYILFTNEYLKIIPLFLFVFVLNVILHSIFYVNIALTSIKKSQHIIVSIITSYLLFIIIDIIEEVLVGDIIFSKIIDIDIIATSINLFNIWVHSQSNMLILTLNSIIIVLITFIILYNTYKNKEEVIIESEK